MELLLAVKANPKIHAEDNRNVLEYMIAKKGDTAFTMIKQLYVGERMAESRKQKGKLTHLHLCCCASKRVRTTKIAEMFIDYSYDHGKFLNATEGQGR